MSRKKDAFNTPFRKLKLPKRPEQPAPAKPAAPAPARPKADEDDTSAFLQAMSGVARLGDNAPSRVEPAKREQAENPDDEALALAELEELVQGGGEFRLHDTDEFVWGLAPGVNNQLLRTLRRGGFSFRRHLDLHGFSREEARAELTRFVAQSRRDGERCVLVVTGRGKRSPDQVSVLRQALPRWLSRAPLRAHVLGFCTAQPGDGGPGAFYVLLRRAGVRPYGFGVEPQ